MIHDSSLNEKYDCNDFTINSLDVNCVNDMQNPKLGDASFAMSTTCCNDHDWGDFLSTPIAPLTDTESCEINTALLNLVMKYQLPAS